jgi:ATP-binding cassette subfamily B protein
MEAPTGFRANRTMRSFTADRRVASHKLAPGTLRRIVGFARPFAPALALFVVLILVGALVTAAQPLLFKQIIDEGVMKRDGAVVIGSALTLAGLAALTAIIGLAQRYISARIGQGLVHDLRVAVFDRVQEMPIGFFSRTQTGALVTRLNDDVQGAQQAFTSTLSNVVGNLATAVAVLAAMLALSWEITLASLLLIPLFLLPAKLVGRRLAVITRERYALSADMGQTMTERFNVAGATLVKVFGRSDAESAAFADRARRVRDIGVTSAVYSRVLMTSLGLLAALATAAVYGIGGVMAIDGALAVGTVVALTAYLAQLYGPITSLSNLQVDVMTTLVSFERVFEVLDLEPMVADREDARPLPRHSASVELDHVSFAYPSAAQVSLASLESVASLSDTPNNPILHDIHFRAEPGQMIALVGASGAGKSTIAHLISRLYDVTGGSVRVGGVDVRDVTQSSLRDAIGVVTQDAHMFHASLRSNLAYARPEATEDEMWRALDAAQIGELVRALPEGLDTVVGDRGYRLSGGEKQRLAIARVLLKAPPIIVLDEATAHLDAESEAAVQRALAAALAGRTSIVIAHRLSTVRDADLILVIDAGRVIERGAHEELLAAGGAYAELCQVTSSEANDRASDRAPAHAACA